MPVQGVHFTFLPLHTVHVFSIIISVYMLRDILIVSSGVPRNFVRGGSTNSVGDRGNGDLGAVAP